MQLLLHILGTFFSYILYITVYKTLICKLYPLRLVNANFPAVMASGLPGWGRHSIDAVRMAGPCGMLRLPGAAPCCSSVLFVACWAFCYFFSRKIRHPSMTVGMKSPRNHFPSTGNDNDICRGDSWKNMYFKEFMLVLPREWGSFRVLETNHSYHTWTLGIVNDSLIIPIVLGGNERLWNDKHRRLGKAELSQLPPWIILT